MNILFYSNKCHYSNLFLNKLKDENMINDFKLINVLEVKNIDIPDIITSVPTIIVKNINTPLVGINAFNWLDNNKFFYQKTNNINNKIKPCNVNYDYLTIDHNKNKDFANLDDREDDKSIDIKFNRALNVINITEMGNIENKIKEDKIKEDIYDKKLNELLILRKMQMKQLQNNNNSSNIK